MRKTIYIFIQGNPLGKKLIPFSRLKYAISTQKTVIPFKRFIHSPVIHAKKINIYFTPRVRTVCAVII